MENDKYIGKLLDDRYEILEVIGNGGMAVVYKARCRRLNRMVAVKILKDEFSQDEDFRRRFHAESQAVAMLSHPNIVSVYDVSSSKDSDYIVMELIDGISLKYYMEKKGVLNWKETLHFAMQIAKALEHAHSRGIVHRDIKPHNVMVLKNGSVKVADFGIAQIMSTTNTMTQEALGSVHYISPEQAKGSRVDSRSDVYSLGIVMYEMISGRVPYDGDTPVAVVMKHINGNAPLPTTLNPNTPKGLEQIIMKAMAQQPKDRYATATAMLYDMDEFRKDPTMVFPETRPEVRVIPPVAHVPETDSGAKTIAQKKVTPTKAVRRSRTTAIAISSCAVVGLVALIIVIILLSNSCQSGGGTVEVPNLVGQYYDTLPKQDVQVLVQGYDYREGFADGQIIEQSPEAGSAVAKGTKVYVIVSKGLEKMPDVTSMTLEKAEKTLHDLQTSLVVTLVKENSTEVPKGDIIRTEPVAGENLHAGQEVKIYYSIGVETMYGILPDVTGASLDSAKALLTEAGFSNFREEKMDSTLPRDVVVGLSVKTGSMVDFDKENKVDVTQAIVIYISQGLPVKDMSGMTLEEAMTYLNGLGLEMMIIPKAEANDEIPFGEIIRTEPAAGEYIASDEEIQVYYSGVTAVPDVRGKTVEEAKEILTEAGFTNLREKETSGLLTQGTVVMLSDDPGVQALVSNEIILYVSKGNQGLRDLTGMTMAEATSYIDSLDLGLTVVEKSDSNSTAPAGTITRTEPGTGETVSFGQEITVYCSTGPVTAEVPDVEGDTLSDAQNKLNDAGFYSLKVEEMDSDAPAGRVIALSVTAGQQVRVDQTIIIYVARQSSQTETTISKLFVIPAREESALVTITCDGETVYEQELDPTVNTVRLTLTGSGTKQYVIAINGQKVSTEMVEFNPDE